MHAVKNLLRSLFPSLYLRLWLWKENKEELPTNFAPYYKGVSESMDMTKPEACLTALSIPSHVDTILDIGCASGRNFIPFDGTLRLWGVDIAPASQIHWVRPFKNLTYEQMTLEAFTERLEKEPIDMTHTLVFTAGTMAYCSKVWQTRFYEACKKNGCTNFIFHEYPPQDRYPTKNFKLPQEDFTAKKFREQTRSMTFFRLLGSMFPFDLSGVVETLVMLA